MTKLAQLIAREEGFFKKGSLPQRRLNPGDLRHGLHVSHAGLGPNDIGLEDTEAHGWEDLERQLGLMAARGLSLQACIAAWAPPSENDTEGYLKFVCEGLGVPPETPLKEALGIKA